jgi:hypothetical protein
MSEHCSNDASRRTPDSFAYHRAPSRHQPDPQIVHEAVSRGLCPQSGPEHIIYGKRTQAAFIRRRIDGRGFAGNGCCQALSLFRAYDGSLGKMLDVLLQHFSAAVGGEPDQQLGLLWKKGKDRSGRPELRHGTGRRGTHESFSVFARRVGGKRRSPTF